MPSPLPPSRKDIAVLVLVVVGLFACQSADHSGHAPSEPTPRFNGRWVLIEARSSAIDPWNDLTVTVEIQDSRLRLHRHWHGPTDYTAVDSLNIPMNGASHRVPLPKWPDNRHIGAFARTDRPRQVSAEWLDQGRTLGVTSRFWVEVSQGVRRIRTYSEYRLAPDGDRLVVLELRSTRPRARRYVLKRSPPPGSDA